MKGWRGRILRVDLDRGSACPEPLSEELAGRFLGGRGLGVYWLYSEALGAEPLRPQNLVVLATGPLTGTVAPGAGRITAVTRSPLTGTVCDSSAGGAFGVRLKHCGYDALIVRGRAPVPVYLEITPQEVRLEEAGDLWGLEVPAAVARIRARAGALSSVVAIGPAGERLVPYACASVDGRRHFGRGGLGAVMGSKNLKAVVVSGRGRIELADEENFLAVRYEAEKLLAANPVTAQALPEFGTAVLVHLVNQARSFPVRNFQDGYFETAEALSGENFRARFFRRRSACWGCGIGCGRVLAMAGQEWEGPEYESIWSLGADLGIEDPETVIRANALCNRLGLDTISTGGTLACAMELSSRGLGPEGLTFGAGDKVLQLIPRIARREAEGEELALGSRVLAARRGAPELAMQVKGMELPAYDPRGLQGQGLGFATSNRGGCHLRANMLGPEILGIPKLVDRLQAVGKAGLLIYLQHNHAALDSLVVCKFAALALSEEHFARLLRAATGLDWRAQDLQLVGERIWNLERAYNLRVGFGPRDDTLPPRLLAEPGRGRPVELSAMLQEYYRFRNWGPDGSPAPAKIRQLGLEGLLAP
ncbi:MAG: aldehyde ferredoxin oxidoreductase family protein [Clostridia bacterium]|nr:aldehyde ferredoxin oxidoreductase family protein [Clostridia bacterium]MDH7573315.1 aldehyde ferredoxin oxidoreductase family protein [Clostridia bacterium]